VKQVVVSQFIQWVASVLVGLGAIAVPAALSRLLDFRHIEDLEHPQGAMGFEALISTPPVSLVVVIDMHQQKGIAPLGRDNDGAPVVAKPRASHLVVERLLDLLEMNAALGTVLLEFPNQFADLLFGPWLEGGQNRSEHHGVTSATPSDLLLGTN
jgi:hypothetical protein